MGQVITPELELAIQQLIGELLIKYGLIVVLVIGAVFVVGWHWFRSKLEGEVQKGVDKHKADIDNTYARQIENYHLYVGKQHEAYAKLNEHLIRAESMAVFQALKSYPDFTQYSEDEISDYLNERMVTKKELTHMIGLMRTPKELQTEMQNYTERFNIRKARDLFNETKNHYWLSALYFSNQVSAQFETITQKLSEMILTREIPSNGDRLSRDDMNRLRDLQKQLKPDIDKIIMQMKSELSAGLAK